MSPRSVFLSIFLLSVLTTALALNLGQDRSFRGVTEEQRNLTEETRAVQESEARIRKHKLKYIFPLLFGYGGFYTIAALIAIKFKIVIVALFIFGAFFYGFKIWAGKGIGCPEPSIVKEAFYPHGITGYSHSAPEVYSGPISYTPPTYDTGYPSVPYSADVASYGGDHGSYPEASPAGDSPPTGTGTSGGHYKRNGRRRRDAPNSPPVSMFPQINLDFTELIFTFLSVNSMECRRRFTCEVDFLARKDPFVQMGYKVMGPKLFAEYRSLETQKVQKFRDCGEMYPECKTPYEEEAAKVSSVEVSSSDETQSNRISSKTSPFW